MCTTQAAMWHPRVVAINESDSQRWTRRAGDAAIEAVLNGADPDTVRAAVEAGIREGQRVRALAEPAPTAAPTVSAPPVHRSTIAAPGSAFERLLRDTGVL